ncbi:MAG TPA: N-acetylmuramoyl-L-alanine amidase [Kiritimatiellia bacterium]|nr:N-acetylmuramoyl-L-alanine amidase [Kiritimatiellia bacterium]HMO99062.1 N-acetylmuramoyl-L-alanine amidase [Kiritimatiellia bacterium]HMP97591.1 N-acetylmuramoyl-L-alanine amidase [Kiritimatiellia bacterium]
MNRLFWQRRLLVAGIALAATGNAWAQPDWSELDRFQETIRAETFGRLLQDVYAPEGRMVPYLRYGENAVRIFSTAEQEEPPLFVLRFGDDRPPERPEIGRTDAPLAGLRVALDPGHIGGAWARMEERFFLVNRRTDWPVQEAALNIHVARLLRDRLAAAGAEVLMVKDDFEPVTPLRPDALLEDAGPLPPPDSRFDHLPDPFIEAARRDAQRKQVERQFYRTAEIAARAERINRELRPDVTLCIHFNATGWGDEKTLYEENGLTFFIHGNYQAAELAADEQKFFLMRKLLERSHEEELGLARAIADAYMAATGLPPAYRVGPGGAMHPMSDDHYLYARNLAANRQFFGPVIFLEPYFMNNRIVYARIQAGDYDGEREIEGAVYPSIFREYADAVAAGVIAYYARPAD